MATRRHPSAVDRDGIPVVAERARVEVRPARRRRVRVRRRVIAEPRVIEAPIRHEHVEVERVELNRFVDRAPAPRQEGDTLIVPCVEEVAVIEKRLLLREELRIRVVREQRVDRQTVTLRRHELEVEHEQEDVLEPQQHKGEGS